jgi:hypothetical protein
MQSRLSQNWPRRIDGGTEAIGMDKTAIDSSQTRRPSISGDFGAAI